MNSQKRQKRSWSGTISDWDQEQPSSQGRLFQRTLYPCRRLQAAKVTTFMGARSRTSRSILTLTHRDLEESATTLFYEDHIVRSSNLSECRFQPHIPTRSWQATLSLPCCRQPQSIRISDYSVGDYFASYGQGYSIAKDFILCCNW